jgi:putative RNA 2'-phosphotransferase
MSNRKSKYLSYILRHKPEAANITLDNAGWTDVRTLLSNVGWKMYELEHVVESNNKSRFEFNENKSQIRARQGHSVPVNLGYGEVSPPEYLFHGTATRYLDSIMKEGLKPMSRHQVHLSKDLITASQVGSRHGKLVILRVLAKKMVDDLGSKFFHTANEVWLTDYVPHEYIEIKECKQASLA